MSIFTGALASRSNGAKHVVTRESTETCKDEIVKNLGRQLKDFGKSGGNHRKDSRALGKK